MELKGVALMHGISPFDDRAGVAEWQTSRFPRKDCPSSTIMSMNEAIGASTVNASTTRSMTVIDLMCKV